MVKLSKTNSQGESDERKKAAKKHSGSLADRVDVRGAKKTVSEKHSHSGKFVYGVRRRTCKPENAERISEDSEEYSSTTRHIESSLGIKTYTELAPYLAKGVERVMASLVNAKPDELIISPEFICRLHNDAFGELFPSWAGKYRDRDVTVGKHNPPPYFEVPVLMRQYCDDLEFRLSSRGLNPQINDELIEVLAFAEGRILSVHPFLDFNGRIARMLLFALLYRLNLPPISLVPEEKNKAEYLKALSEADRFNWHPLIEIWRNRLGREK